jgi:predicted NUDIX family phosphoesterase
MGDELVMAFPSCKLHELGYFQGFSPDFNGYVNPILKESFFAPREAAEMDASLKQLIPYAILHHNGLLFRYRRTDRSKENRLRSLYSIGIGGHINPEDSSGPARGGASLGASGVVEAAVMREIGEEVSIDCTSKQCIGVINDDAVSVGRVHFGLVFLCALDTPRVTIRERSSIEDGALVRPSSISFHIAEYESWSRILMELRSEWL